MNANTAGPNQGRILAKESKDGVTFGARKGGGGKLLGLTSPPAKSETLFTQRDVDIRYDRVNKQLLMLQGDVGANQIFWSLSDDLGALLTLASFPCPCLLVSEFIMLRLRFRVNVAPLGGHSHDRCPQRQRMQYLQQS